MEKLKEFLLKPVYKSIKVWHIALFVIIVGVVVPSQEEEKENDDKKSEKKVEKIEMTPLQANEFMAQHCVGSGQRLLDMKEINYGDGLVVFAFLTEASSPGYYCVTTVNKTIYSNSQEGFKNAIFNADCGSNEKLMQWEQF